MASKSASIPAKTRPAGRHISATPTKSVRMSRLEAKRLEQFKALMLKYGGKCLFAGFDG